MWRVFLIGLVLGTGLLADATPAGAASATSAEAPRVLRLAADRSVDLGAAVRKVKRRYGDVTVLKAETRGQGNKRVHRIKFLTDEGRVRTVRVDARTGEFK